MDTTLSAAACAAVALLACGLEAHATDLTATQRREVVRVNQDVNWRSAHVDPATGHGLCWLLAWRKRAALEAAGIPADAMTLRVVASPRGLHELLDVAGVGALDMNDDWPEDAAEQARMGYTAVTP